MSVITMACSLKHKGSWGRLDFIHAGALLRRLKRRQEVALHKGQRHFGSEHRQQAKIRFQDHPGVPSSYSAS